MSASMRKGTGWETKIVEYLRTRYWPHAERRAKTGAVDKGDIAGIIGVVIEAKNHNQHNFAGWLDEAKKEALNAHADFGVAWIHRRGYASAKDGFVVMDGETFTDLLRDAGYGVPSSQPTEGEPS